MILVEALLLIGLLTILYFVAKVAFWAGKKISQNIKGNQND